MKRSDEHVNGRNGRDKGGREGKGLLGNTEQIAVVGVRCGHCVDECGQDLMELAFRFIVGGLVVSLFAVLGDVFKPKSFAGLFGAAPSVAIATLGLGAITHGSAYAATESRSMMIGAFAFLFYALVCMWVLTKRRLAAACVCSAALVVWGATSLVGYFLVLR
jgi:uncharacterized membrane protein (GlpM family)